MLSWSLENTDVATKRVNFNLGSCCLVDHRRNDAGFLRKEEARSAYRGGAKTGCGYKAATCEVGDALRQRGNRGDSPDRVCGRSEFRSAERYQVHYSFLRVCNWSSRIMCARIAKELDVRGVIVRSKLITSFFTVHRPQVQAQSHS